MRIKSIHILLAIIIIIGGGILLASELDLYNTTRVKSPRKTAEGVYDVIDMRGSHTLEEIEKYYQLPAFSVVEAFGLKVDTNPNTFKLKDLKEIFKPVEIEGEEYIIETDTIRVFASLYLKNSYISDETFYLPERTVNYLVKNNKLDDKEKKYWLGHTFKAEYLDGDDLAVPVVQKITEEKVESFEITGKTAIQELLAQGVNEEKFEEVTGFKVPKDKTIILKDFISEKGIEFKEIKDKFSEISRNN
ncbi:MAG: hypothetical protein U9N03_05550 [Candidatus Caldatribacteriota bacterium]|nr:hypothetical protein [Candidatus Caldatribacteriota bacterium]